MNNRGQLYVMVGPPFSGKTHYIQHQFVLDFPDINIPAIINPDEFRRALTGRYTVINESAAEDIIWASISLAIRALLMAGTDVVLDTCNIRRHQRSKWKIFQPVFIVMDTPLRVSMDRALLSDRPGVDRLVRYSYDSFDPVHVTEGARIDVTFEPVAK